MLYPYNRQVWTTITWYYSDSSLHELLTTVVFLHSHLSKLTAVHLVDSHYCADPAKFISVLCTSLSTMLHVELPHVNVLSKMDLIEQYGKLGTLKVLGFTSTITNVTEHKTPVILYHIQKWIYRMYRGNIFPVCILAQPSTLTSTQKSWTWPTFLITWPQIPSLKNSTI